MNRLASLRNSRSRGAEYNKLDDEETGFGRERLRLVTEVEEPVGYDLSGFDGSISMSNINSDKKVLSAADAREQERDLNEAGYAAEYERLEAQLGSGMASVMEVPFVGHADPGGRVKNGHRRVLSDSKAAQSTVQEAQKEAEKTGEIVAITEITVDISDLTDDTNESETRSVLTTGHKENGETSYYFPPGML